jgi:hypothetical protein
MHPLRTLLILPLLFVVAQATTFTFKPVDSISGDGNHNDLGDLDHTKAYTWGITGTSTGPSYSTLLSQLSTGYVITGATISISNLYNWDRADTGNQLFMHLLDNPETGVDVITDDPGDTGVNDGVVSDYFGGALSTNKVNYKYVAYGYSNWYTPVLLSTGATNIGLTTYADPDGPVTVDQFSFLFTQPQLVTLTSYITNGHTGGSGYADFGLGFDPDCHYSNDGVTFTITTGQASVPDGGATLLLVLGGLAALVPLRSRLFAQAA